MTVKIGSYGNIRAFEDFHSLTSTTMGTSRLPQGNVMYSSVNEGSFALTVDEPGGIIAATTDTANGDNIAFHFSPIKISDGVHFIEARFKSNDASNSAVFCGFCTAMDATTPVCPIEYDGTTQTTNEAGSSIGMLMDASNTDVVWSAVAGNDSAAATGSPTDTTDAMGDDEWQVTRVIVNPDGSGECWLAKSDSGLSLIKRFAADTLTTTDIMFPCLIHENRSAAARVFEVDYMAYGSGRDWDV